MKIPDATMNFFRPLNDFFKEAMMDELDRTFDTALLLWAQAGDSSALEELIVRHESPLRYFVRRLVNDPATADDVVQEVWLATLRQVKCIRSGAALRVWLYRVARNLAVSYHRGAIARRARPLEDAVEVPADEDLFIPAEDAAEIHQALGTLSVEHREVLTLRFLQDMSYEDLAAVIDCSVGTVRSRLHYAKKQLLQALQGRSPDIGAGKSQSTGGVTR